VKKPKYLSPKQHMTKIGQWRYVSSEEWEQKKRQTMEEEFKHITTRCMHLGPHSAQRIIPYPPLPKASFAIGDRTMSPSTSLPPMDMALPLPSGSRCKWE
jgi:hypothetical protein